MLKKSLFAALACSAALVFTSPASVQAAGMLGPGTKVQTESMIDLVHAKKKAKPAKKAKKAKKGKAKASKAGSCGTYMYWSSKSRKCMDARAKR